MKQDRSGNRKQESGSVRKHETKETGPVRKQETVSTAQETGFNIFPVLRFCC